MGIFSFFRRPTPEEATRSIVEKFVLASLLYSKELAHPDNQQSADAGAEVAYLLLHLLDAEIFARFGTPRRDAIFDSIAQNVIVAYTKSVLRPETPLNLLFEAAKQMQDTLNSRQITYARCRSFLGGEGGFPGIGTMVFAFCFFVHRALGRTNRTDVDDILAGEKTIPESDGRSDFPDIETLLYGVAWLGPMIKTIQIQNDTKYLR